MHPKFTFLASSWAAAKCLPYYAVMGLQTSVLLRLTSVNQTGTDRNKGSNEIGRINAIQYFAREFPGSLPGLAALVMRLWALLMISRSKLINLNIINSIELHILSVVPSGIDAQNHSAPASAVAFTYYEFPWLFWMANCLFSNLYAAQSRFHFLPTCLIRSSHPLAFDLVIHVCFMVTFWSNLSTCQGTDIYNTIIDIFLPARCLLEIFAPHLPLGVNSPVTVIYLKRPKQIVPFSSAHNVYLSWFCAIERCGLLFCHYCPLLFSLRVFRLAQRRELFLYWIPDGGLLSCIPIGSWHTCRNMLFISSDISSSERQSSRWSLKKFNPILWRVIFIVD